MKPFYRCLPFLLLVILGLASCGYHNPYVYNGPARSVYITPWKNKTNELRLEAKIYQSLVKWYQKSGSITVKQDKEGADLILAGEILSISLPSLSYGANNITQEVKLHLMVRYILKDMRTGKVLVEVPNQIFSETYLISTSNTLTKDNEFKALDTIIDDLAEKIYLSTLNELRHY